MDEHRDTATDLFHLFLRYLAVGQYECARLIYRYQQQQQQPASSKFDRALKLIVCGFRPQEWIYTAACPSSSHLAWFCASLLSSSSGVFPPLLLSANSLLQSEAGLVVHEQHYAKPVERARLLADWLLSDEDRLCKLLLGPPHQHELVRLVWRDLQEQCCSEAENAAALVRVLHRVCNGLVAKQSPPHRIEQAVALFATTKGAEEGCECPAGLVDLVAAADDDTAQLVATALLKHGCVSAFKHSSLFSKRCAGRSLHAYIIRSLRTLASTTGNKDDDIHPLSWFAELVEDDPFSKVDSPPTALVALHVLTSTTAAAGAGVDTSKLLRAAAAPPPSASGCSLATRIQLHVNELAYAVFCNRVRELVLSPSTAAATTASTGGLLTPIFLMPALHGGGGAHRVASSKAIFQALEPLSGGHVDWLSPTQRSELLMLCVASWVHDASSPLMASLLLGLACTEEEEVWIVRFLAGFDAKLMGPYLHAICKHASVKREFALRLQISTLENASQVDAADIAVLQLDTSLSPVQLVDACFRAKEWDLALDVLQCFAAAHEDANLWRELEREARVMQALERKQEGGIAFAAEDEQDFEFQRHHLVQHEGGGNGVGGVHHHRRRQEELITSLVDTNMRSVDLFVLACEESKLDPCQVLVEYYELQQQQTGPWFHELVRGVEAKFPFPSAAATRAFHCLVGMDVDPVYTALTERTAAGVLLQPAGHSEYSLEGEEEEGEDVGRIVRAAAACLGFDVEFDDDGVKDDFRFTPKPFSSAEEEQDADDDDVIDGAMAVELLRSLGNKPRAQRFCARLAAHLVLLVPSSSSWSSARWMLTTAMDALQREFAFEDAMSSAELRSWRA